MLPLVVDLDGELLHLPLQLAVGGQQDALLPAAKQRVGGQAGLAGGERPKAPPHHPSPEAGVGGGRYLSSACSRSCSSSTRASSCETLPLGFCSPSELAKRFFSSLFCGEQNTLKNRPRQPPPFHTGVPSPVRKAQNLAYVNRR